MLAVRPICICLDLRGRRTTSASLMMGALVYRPDALPAKAAAHFTRNTATERTDLVS